MPSLKVRLRRLRRNGAAVFDFAVILAVDSAGRTELLSPPSLTRRVFDLTDRKADSHNMVLDVLGTKYH